MEELVEAKNEGVNFILCAGGGTRARHVYSLGLDLDLPTGMLARLGASIPVQNARMLQLLLAKDGGIMAYAEEFDASSKVTLELELLDDSVHAVEMNERMQVYCAQAAERLAPGEWMNMQSGAAHDAQVLAPKIASGMIFVPSIGGISHDFNEDTAEEDIILGCQVMASAAEAILQDEVENVDLNTRHIRGVR